METISPALSEAYRLLRLELYVHLDIAECHGLKNCWDEDDIRTARELIPDLVLVIRQTMAAHEPDEHGQCVTCHATWPCPVVCLLHSLIKDPELQLHKLVVQDREP